MYTASYIIFTTGAPTQIRIVHLRMKMIDWVIDLGDRLDYIVHMNAPRTAPLHPERRCWLPASSPLRMRSIAGRRPH